MKISNEYLAEIYEACAAKDGDQPEFLQALEEVLESLVPIVEKRPDLVSAGIIERIVEPERIITFRVSWADDSGRVRVNRAYRVQYNSALGPYKGGIRFHPSVNLSVMKFLGFEQLFKNSLTGLPMGGGKGGSDFDPKGKSDAEIMRFCQSFTDELVRHIGPDTDVPAGDIGVGAREIGYMYGRYKRLTNLSTGGVFTGKAPGYGGSLGRKEATGYGLVYFTEALFRELLGETLDGKTAVLSGSGNVAVYAAQKAEEKGIKVVAMSDSDGYIHDPAGIDLDIIKDIKEVRRARISEYAALRPGSVYTPGCGGIWSVPCDIALPCATQNELDAEGARMLVKNRVRAVAEGANMPCTKQATEIFADAGVIFAPGKAANAGGVAVSGLEMAQNSGRLAWSFEQVDRELKEIMNRIFASVLAASEQAGRRGNLAMGANIAGFLKVAEAMKAFGVTY